LETPHVISAVIVHFQGHDLVVRCVESCLASPAIAEVLVVDNEGVGRRLRHAMPIARVRVIEMTRNSGYGKAANVGLQQSRESAVLVLNQDTEIPPDAVEAMVEAGKSSKAWLVGPRLVDKKGREAPSKEAFPPPLLWTDRAGGGEGWRERPWIAGAAMLFTEGHTGLRFDERLFMYAEDEELCWRVWASGGRVVVAEDALVVHQGGTATARRWGRNAVAIRTVANRARFVRWHAGWRAAAAYAGAAIGAAARNRLRGLGRRV
jgi:N-acetylglucosaminyl-diphospho-decaprenol L-rhamnosyltransferase